MMLMVERPQIKITFGLIGEILEDVALANDLNDRHVHFVVPVSDSFFFCNITFQVETHEIAMHGDMLEHAFEAVWDGEFDVFTRAKFIHARAFEEVHLITQDLQVFRFYIRRDIDACVAFAHFCVDVFLPLSAGYRYTVMTVHNEINLADLIENDRGQVDILVESAIYTLPATGKLV